MNNEFKDFYYTSNDGLKLHARIYGEKNAPGLPIVCLAGLTRNAADFHELAVHLAGGATPHQVIAFDYRGRGRSAYDRNWNNYDPIVEAGDVVAGLTALDIEHAAFIGTSRGGLITFVLAAMRPSLLRAVVLNDIGPVVEGTGLAQIRSYLERAPSPSTFEEAIAIQRSAQQGIFTGLSDADWDRAVRALYRDDNGRPVPDFDPALLNTLKSVNLSKALPEFWPQFLGLSAVPVLAIRGENSKLLSAETLTQMKARHPDLETITVAGQGHAPFLETAGLPGKIEGFLNRKATSAKHAA
ncbi:alpha/beta hydrolase [Mesorhizobium sp. Z1-4]|uniref:alpha/beta fold hydrolase n=1 Tax=Mesorhizobium sp. Z1-4 TaxID=2448478 RepID=UPI000FDBF2D6|nr:alpha/beta hydrolase [Mesorhizobium sp. Z1-4]